MSCIFGIYKRGCHYVIPVQAKGGHDQISVVQAKQDIARRNQRFIGMRCRAISAPLSDERIAMFELTLQGDLVKVRPTSAIISLCQQRRSTKRQSSLIGNNACTRYRISVPSEKTPIIEYLFQTYWDPKHRKNRVSP